MIFVSTGTEKYPFIRLIKLIDEAKGSGLIRDKVIIQDGALGSGYHIASCLSYSIVPHEQMIKLVRECDLYICHGGAGSIITGLEEGKMPIVVPRYAKYREHVDDHQLDITDEFVKRGQIIACYDGDDAVDRANNYKAYAKNLKRGYENKKDELLSFIKGIIESGRRNLPV